MIRMIDFVPAMVNFFAAKIISFYFLKNNIVAVYDVPVC